MKAANLENRIFSIKHRQDFESTALDIFCYQYENNSTYNFYCRAINRKPGEVDALHKIPFLPIEFFKAHQILNDNVEYEEIFTSSGTTGSQPSKHYVADLSLYEKTFYQAFFQFYGNLKGYVVLALLPSYLERTGSSLIYMANAFIKSSKHPESGFYLHEYEKLAKKLKRLDAQGQKVLLIGVSFGLLDLVESETFSLKNTIVMETGGMKGRRKEMTRQELHQILAKGFGVNRIHSEYGMTELLSQAYSQGEGLFSCPSTMQVLIREPEDPFHFLSDGKNGGLNVIDLANLHSCSFIATQDLGRKHASGKFEILGRFDHSDIRGCNLLVL